MRRVPHRRRQEVLLASLTSVRSTGRPGTGFSGNAPWGVSSSLRAVRLVRQVPDPSTSRRPY